LQGRTLTGDINRLAARTMGVRQDLNGRLIRAADDINRLTEEVRGLNIRIASAEGSDTLASDAVGLRDQRNTALSKLAELVNVRVQEQADGTVTIYSGGDFLVFGEIGREVKVSYTGDRGLLAAELRLAETDSPLEASAGEVSGLIAARDQVLGGFLDQLNSFAATLAFNFNKIFSSGQGLSGFSQLTSTFAVDSPNAALDAAGLSFSPVNGSFQVKVLNRRTGLTETADIRVDLNGLDEDTSLVDLAAQLDAVDGISASVSTVGRLTISRDSPDHQFAFAQDSSGVLAALGLNTFFTGDSANSLGVNQVVIDDPAKFAASQGGIGQDTLSAVELAGFLDRPLSDNDGATLSILYDRLAGAVTQGSTVAQAVADGARVFEESLRGQALSISGVNIDEEVVRMIQYQRTFQAAARYIGVMSELLDLLVNL